MAMKGFQLALKRRNGEEDKTLVQRWALRNQKSNHNFWHCFQHFKSRVAAQALILFCQDWANPSIISRYEIYSLHI